MIPPLRPYQVDQVRAVYEALGAGATRPLVVAATGTGKSTSLARIAELAVCAGWRVLVAAHRIEILAQLRDRCALGRLPSGRPIPVGLERADARSRGEPVVVGSVQTLSPARLAAAQAGGQAPFSLVLVDEAHHAPARSYDPLFDLGIPLVGFTATPDRSDGVPLHERFDTVAHVYDIADAQRDGYLTPVATASAHSIDHLLYYLRGARSVVFASSVEASKALAYTLTEHGLRAAHLDGTTHPLVRAATLRAFADRDLDVLCNYNILTEGWDCPGVDVVAVMRDTSARATRAQMVGRGLRPAPGKAMTLVVELPCAEALDLATPADPLGRYPLPLTACDAR